MTQKVETASTPSEDVKAQASHLIANREKLERLLTQLHSLSEHEWRENYDEIAKRGDFEYKETVLAAMGEASDFFTEYKTGAFSS